MTLEKFSDDEFEEMVTELETITFDFCENYDIDVTEFNGLVLAQLVRQYHQTDQSDSLLKLLQHTMDIIASEKNKF